MPITRRFLMTTAIPAFSLLATGLRAHAADISPNFAAPRTVGNINAKVYVEEWFSLTCAHCGRFAQEVFPEIKKQFIDTGKVFYIFKDFPLDKIALAAAMVARSLPVDQYQPFVLALLDNLDQWAFAQNVDPLNELKKYAMLAGMSSDTFEKTINDTQLRDVILKESQYAQDHYKIDSTPTFVFNGKPVTGELTPDEFGNYVTKALSRQPTSK